MCYVDEEANTRIKRVLDMAKHAPKGSYTEYEYYKERIGRIAGLTSTQYQTAIQQLTRILQI